MTFPTTGLLDDFNRANEAVSASANWSAPTYDWSDGSPVIVSNQVTGSGESTINDAYWSAANFGPDCEAWLTVATVSGDMYLDVRLSNAGASNVTGYDLTIIMSTFEWTIYRIDNSNSFIPLGAQPTQVIEAGGSVGLEAIGTTLKAYYKAPAGAWTEVMSRTDSTYTTAGRIGFGVTGNVIQVDNFNGGTVAVPPTGKAGRILRPQRGIFPVRHLRI